MATYSVDGNSGVMTMDNVDNTGFLVLTNVDVEECEITFAMDWITGGVGNIYPEAVYRLDSDLVTGFSAKFTVDLDYLTQDTITNVELFESGVSLGSATMSLVKPVGGRIRVKIRSTTNNFVRAWVEGTSEPTTWDLVAGSGSTLSGTVGLAAQVQLDASIPASMTTIHEIIGFEVPTLTGANALGSGNPYVNDITNITLTAPGGGFDGVGTAGVFTVSSGVNASVAVSVTTISARFATAFHFKIQTSLPAGDLRLFGTTVSSIAPDPVLLVRASDGRLVFTGGGGAPVAVGPVISADVWYRIDIGYNHSVSTTIAIDWSVDGVAQTAATSSPGASTTTTAIYGSNGTPTSPTAVFLMDDIVMSSTIGDYPIGEERVIQLLPTSTITEVGTANAMARFTADGGGLDATFNATDILAAVLASAVSPAASIDGVYQRTSGVGNFASIPMQPYVLQAGEGFSGARYISFGWAATTSVNTWSVLGNTGGADEVLFALAAPGFRNQPVVWLCRIYNTAGGWDQTKINNLRFKLGGSNDISPLPGTNYLQAEVVVRSADVGAATIDLLFDDFEVCALEDAS